MSLKFRIRLGLARFSTLRLQLSTLLARGMRHPCLVKPLPAGGMSPKPSALAGIEVCAATGSFHLATLTLGTRRISFRPAIRFKSASLSVLAGLLCCPATAQPYVIDWFTLDGGGGVSTGGVYTIQGTIGQPDAGLSSGGPYSLVGGFWGVVEAVQTPGAPLLSIAHIPELSTMNVSWPLPATGFVLDQSPTVTGAWSQVAFPYSTNATHISVTVSPPVGDRFYRLRKP